MFVTNWISTTKIQKISEITNFFRHYFLSRTEVKQMFKRKIEKYLKEWKSDEHKHSFFPSTWLFC